MGYLVCDKCGGYYELQPGESPDDFTDECDCGGKTRYVETLEESGELEELGSTITCPYCGTDNPADRKICKSCKKFLVPLKSSPKTGGIKDSTPSSKSKGGIMETWDKQSTPIKALSILGVCCVGLILILGITAMFSPDQTTDTNLGDTQPTTTDNQQTSTAQATWHSVTTFTGTGNKQTNAFPIKGNKYKVKITANAEADALEYAGISFFGYPEGESDAYNGYGDMSTFSQTTMTDEFEVTARPGNHYLKVIAANLVDWKIEVFDYY